MPNYALGNTVAQPIEEYFYLTKQWLAFTLAPEMAPYPQPLMPYSITWFDQVVYKLQLCCAQISADR